MPLLAWHAAEPCALELRVLISATHAVMDSPWHKMGAPSYVTVCSKPQHKQGPNVKGTVFVHRFGGKLPCQHSSAFEQPVLGLAMAFTLHSSQGLEDDTA